MDNKSEIISVLQEQGKLRDELIQKLEAHVNDIFLEMQKKLGIEDGKISPYDALELDYQLRELSARMEIILVKQK